MSVDALSASLLRVELFRDLSPRQLSGIARIAERLTFRAGDTITRAGTNGDAAVLIVSGDAICAGELDDGGSDDPIEPGSMIGEMAMLIEHTYGTTVIASGPVRALRIPRSGILSLVEADPVLGQHFISCINGRLKSLAAELRRIDRGLETQVMRATSAGPQLRVLAATGDQAREAPQASG